MTGFNSLALALDGWFDKAMVELPDDLKARVENEFFPMPWDNLDAEQRRSVALQWDYQRDPATEQDRAYWFDYYVRMEDLEGQIRKWEAVGAPTAGDLAQKEARLAELRRELARMEQKIRQARGDYFPQRKCRDDDKASEATAMEYIAYPMAMKILADRLQATPEELAAWIFMGPESGGITAYRHANELNPPPRFYFDCCMGEDYLSPLMACWLRQDELDRFEPADRYVTGAALLERWGEFPSIQTRAYIEAKIAESRLIDVHPTCGGTRGSNPERDDFPPLEQGLFCVAEIEAIERDDFGAGPATDERSPSSCVAVTAMPIKLHFAVYADSHRNSEWWSKQMRNAMSNGLAECRVGSGRRGSKGSLWRPDLIAAWLLERHQHSKVGLGQTAVHIALKKFVGYGEVADERFPLDR